MGWQGGWLGAGELGLLSSHCYFLTGSSLDAVKAFCEEMRSYSSLSSYICLQLDKEEELELCGVFQPFLRTEGELGSRSEHCAAAYCSLLALHRLSVASMKAVLAREGREGKKNRVQEFLGLCFFSKLEKNRVQEILGLCCFKKLVILRGGPVKRTTLYITMKSYPRHTMKFYQWQEFFPFTMKQTNNLL